ncbi:MAG: N-6 DNA methylase [Rubrivivax sp.]|nr:N-6 DNA methylase [Rubrivivax sp.]
MLAAADELGSGIDDAQISGNVLTMLLAGQNPANIANGVTQDADKYNGKTFEYQAANPPYGVEWKPAEAAVREEHARGAAGRFAPGLPAIRDGQMLFSLQHGAIAGVKAKGGGRIGVVHLGSPLFTADAAGNSCGPSPSRV